MIARPRSTRSALVPYEPASNTSPGAKIDELENVDCPLAELDLWVAQGLKKNSVTRGDRDALEDALRVKLAIAIDAAFDDAARPNQPQIVADRGEADRIAKNLFGPASTATFASLTRDLSRALGGVVPEEKRIEFKSSLVYFMTTKILRVFNDTAVAW